MSRKNNENPNVTKVLLSKLHGGKKIQKKYYQQSAFSKDPKPTSSRNERYRKNNNVFRNIVIVTLVFALFDFLVFKYFQTHPGSFEKLQKTAVFWKSNESIQSITPNFAKKSFKGPGKNYPNNKQHLPTKKKPSLSVLKDPSGRKITRNETFKAAKEYYPKSSAKIFCWRDKSGTVHFSNTGFPKKGRFTKLWVRKMDR